MLYVMSLFWMCAFEMFWILPEGVKKKKRFKASKAVIIWYNCDSRCILALAPTSTSTKTKYDWIKYSNKRDVASANTKNVVIVQNISGLIHSRLVVTSTKQQHKISRSLMSQLEKKTEMFFYRWQEALCVPWPNLSVDISTIVNGITVHKVM